MTGKISDEDFARIATYVDGILNNGEGFKSDARWGWIVSVIEINGLRDSTSVISNLDGGAVSEVCRFLSDEKNIEQTSTVGYDDRGTTQ